MKKLLISLMLFAPAIGVGGSLPTLPASPRGGEFTFAVLGDNRGSDTGVASADFLELLAEINRTDARFVLNSGDLVHGYTGKDQGLLRKQWEGYFKAVGTLKVPMFNSPGNHDISSETSGSAELWKEFCGPAYYSFDYGLSRFIALDTSTLDNRIGPEQEKWLAGQLDGAADLKVFIFFHAPPFPVDGHIGSSLDQFPADRDRLHALFVKNRAKIGAVFCGHEHLYNHRVRDGINYYITGGAGAPIYAPRMLGGFYHYMLVTVAKSGVYYKLEKIAVKSARVLRTLKVRSGSVLEDWENGFSWKTWDKSVTGSLTSEPRKHGKGAWKLAYDFKKCQWPLLYTIWDATLDRPNTLAVDLYVPEATGKKLSVTLTLKGKKTGDDEKGRAADSPAAALHRGWNHLAYDLGESWVTGGLGADFNEIDWVLSTTDPKLAGWVSFDSLVGGYGGKDKRLIEDWETGLPWESWNEYVSMAPDAGLHTRGNRGLRLSYDAGNVVKPTVYANLRPELDFSSVKKLAVDIYVPIGGPSSAILMMGDEDRVVSDPVQLITGWNKVSVPLNGSWLEPEARRASTVVGWQLVPSAQSGTSWAVLDNFRAE